MKHRSVFDVIPAEAGIQSTQRTASWIAQKLHCVSRLRGNDGGSKQKIFDPSVIIDIRNMYLYKGHLIPLAF